VSVTGGETGGAKPEENQIPTLEVIPARLDGKQRELIDGNSFATNHVSPTHFFR